MAAIGGVLQRACRGETVAGSGVSYRRRDVCGASSRQSQRTRGMASTNHTGQDLTEARETAGSSSPCGSRPLSSRGTISQPRIPIACCGTESVMPASRSEVLCHNFKPAPFACLLSTEGRVRKSGRESAAQRHGPGGQPRDDRRLVPPGHRAWLRQAPVDSPCKRILAAPGLLRLVQTGL